ncbi:hypothetical protein [Streptomyces nanshensis]|uniref:Uncharacterized protein n=1 Tax=Streptomyces nanshensis TaxID=518642 RepID=A0A1E7L9V8_9ACTN|nr:hypothetical protein [Streptomyces nanshensis]OEV12989.1 hypothetical protein AN218_05625 [Streptomyces nanshensis]
MSPPRTPSGGTGRPRRRPSEPDGFDPTAPLTSARPTVGDVDVAALLRDLVALHEKGGDPYVHRMPEPEPDLALGVLRHAKVHNHRLRPAAVRKQAALIRTKLWRHLEERAPVEQSAGAEDALDAGAELAELAEPLALSSNEPADKRKVKGAVHNKLKRLKGAALGTDADGRPLRLTPQAVRAAEESYAKAERAALARTRAALAEQEAVRARARELLARREQIEANDTADEYGELWAAFWLEHIATLLRGPDGEEDSEPSETRQTALASAVDALTRHLGKTKPVAGGEP